MSETTHGVVPTPADSLTSARTLAQPKMPVQNSLAPGDYAPTSDKIKVMTMKVSKELQSPVFKEKLSRANWAGQIHARHASAQKVYD